MPSPGHQAYRKNLAVWIEKHREDQDLVAQLQRLAPVVLVLWHLDLEPARTVLMKGYAKHPRGGHPWDPLVTLRCLLLALLVSQPSLNKWPNELNGSGLLRALAGFTDRRRPGVGTFYDWLHRLHDGPVRHGCEHVQPPSAVERRRAQTPLPPKPIPEAVPPKRRGRKPGPHKESTKATRRRKQQAARQHPELAVVAQEAHCVTERLVAELKAAQDLPNPEELWTRLATILLEVGVLASARRGLLGNVQQLRVTGDGSPLRTGACRFGRRSPTCPHDPRTRCDCARLASDPDAAWGWDSHRKVWFFGHHFYELNVNVSGHDLPLAITLAPGCASDFTESLRTLDRTRKLFREHHLDETIRYFIADAGHDGVHNYTYCLEAGITPIIPLKTPAPAVHPTRPELRLSPRGVPLCEGLAEMAPWGTAGPDRKAFLCPVRAGRLDRCPKAPAELPAWRCRPGEKWAPSVTLRIRDNPRLCPPVPRNSPLFQELMNLRSGCERSNSVKKCPFELEKAHHRRASFWLIRLHLMAVLQHARAWVQEQDPQLLIQQLLGRAEVPLDLAA